MGIEPVPIMKNRALGLLYHKDVKRRKLITRSQDVARIADRTS